VALDLSTHHFCNVKNKSGAGLIHTPLLQCEEQKWRWVYLSASLV